VTEHDEIAARFAALAPWQTRHVIDGHPYGGELDYSEEGRPAGLFDWFGVPRTVLELGSGEGALTLLLAAADGVERVVALEAWADDVERSRLALELLGRGNVKVVHADPVTADLAEYGRFDVVFCAGLLHRLAEPWHLLARIGAASDRLFLDMHYCFGAETVEVEGYRGRWVEGAFWLTRPSLLAALTDAGWAVRHVSDHPNWVVAHRIWLGCVRGQALA
jgi:SAM-dependent methyltransferase